MFPKKPISSCQLCDAPDNDNMVQCDLCDKWSHFECVGVDSNIVNMDWACAKCTPVTTANSIIEANLTSNSTMISNFNSLFQPHSQPSNAHINNIAQLGSNLPSTSKSVNQQLAHDNVSVSKSKRSTSKRLALELKRLEEERALQEKRDNEFILKKYKLLEMFDDSSESEEPDVTHDPNNDQRKVSEWLNKPGYKETLPFRKTQPNHPVLPSAVSLHATKQIAEPHKSNSRFDQLWMGNISSPPRYCNDTHNSVPMHTRPISTSRLMHGTMNQSNMVYNNDQQSDILSANYSPVPAPQVLSKQHLASRQVLSRELPSFSGHPEDWPLFISCFESSNTSCGFSNEENLVRLQKCLKGNALEAVRSRLMLPANVPHIISTLRMLYGRPELIINTLINKIRKDPLPKAEKLETLVNFALSVQNLCAVMEAANLVTHMCNPILLQELTDRLPGQIKLNWDIYKSTFPVVTISTFSNWLYQIAQAASEVTLLTDSSQQSELKSQKRGFKSKDYVNVHSQSSSTINNLSSSDVVTIQQKFKCRVCQGSCKSVETCGQFLSLSLKDKWNVIKDKYLCRKCLNAHGKNRCRSQNICGKNGCTYKHHQLLHNDIKSAGNIDQPTANESNESSPSAICTHRDTFHNVLFRTIPVTLRGNNNEIKTYAFLDDGSSLTLLEDEIAQELGLSGVIEPLCLKWTSNTMRKEEQSKKLHLEILGANKKCHQIQVRTVNSLDLPSQSLDIGKLSVEHRNLKGVPIESYSNAVPRILIGIDNLHLQVPLIVKENQDNSLVAVKTRLGWTAYGPISGTKAVNPSTCFHICRCENEDNQMQMMMKDYFALDAIKVPEKLIESDENKRARQIMETTAIKTNGKYEIGLLWRFDNISLPSSYQMAKHRLDCLNKRLSKDPLVLDNMNNQIKEYVAKGYARKLTDTEVKSQNSHIWYLPIFPVHNPSKPQKLRMVWDAAAKVGNISLNSMLLKGPDQTASLLAVLIRFRENTIAICGDIREMYHQVKIRADDQHAQRFLWNDGNENMKPSIYVMQVMTFGSTSSPSCAQFIKNINAHEFIDEYPRAVQSIVQNHYVDDMLDGQDTVEETIRLASEVKRIHQNAGFEIRNWLSNSDKVIVALGESNFSNGTKMFSANKDLEVEKILGMWWNTKDDIFTFSLKHNKTNTAIISGTRKPTKREVLKTMMSIFDPIGFLASFIVYVKILQQEVWRSGIRWDEIISDEHYEKWLSWIHILPAIENVQIPRQYFKSYSMKGSTCQMHVFTDASENAYACVIYLRIEHNDHVACSFVGAKTKVAPLTALSIPRLELEAARLGARFAKMVSNSFTFTIQAQYFWTDSKTVLSWLNSDQRAYRQFVAHRVGEILEFTEAVEWRWVPSALNVADEATKWQHIPDLSITSRWFNGPSFLLHPYEEWPANIVTTTTATERESKNLNHHREYVTVIDLDRFSRWRKLVRSLSYVYRFVFNAKAKISCIPTRTGPLVKDEYLQAENYLYKVAQNETYSEEISILRLIDNTVKNGKKQVGIKKLSSIYKNNPYLDENGIIRALGRIDKANVNYNVKRPILLPRDHKITFLIIDHFHRQFHHLYQETIVNELRQYFIIPKIRVCVKKVRTMCQVCKNRRAQPQVPMMSELPRCRLSTFTRPFSFVGLDYFGPMYVSVGRRSEKRWGALLTCLTTRAVHIEIAHSMNTDGCILILRNFIGRRGVPLEIYSDNGSNFHGAERELREDMKQIDRSRLQEEFVNSTTSWHFNPPSAPHMGGCWERLVRSIKTTLYSIMPSRNPSDPLLQSMLIEVESIINSRPLTYIPVDDESADVLTPNHFLLGSANGMKPLGACDDDRVLLRNNWLTSQQYANRFWKKWLREYLPDLTCRTKWFKRVDPIKVDDIVIVVDEQAPRNLWQKGRIIKTFPAKDGSVRKVTVQTKTGVYDRPAVKVAVLDVRKDEAKLDLGINLSGENVADVAQQARLI